MNRLTADKARSLLLYVPETGEFSRKVSGRGGPVGTRTGSLGPDGYIYISVQGALYRGHQLAWLIMTGQWPEHHVDHINGVRSDNRFANLRSATASENGANAKLRKNNRSGFKGVSWNEKSGKWQAHIMVNRKSKYLGTFVTAELAHAAYCSAAEEYFGDFARAV